MAHRNRYLKILWQTTHVDSWFISTYLTYIIWQCYIYQLYSIMYIHHSQHLTSPNTQHPSTPAVIFMIFSSCHGLLTGQTGFRGSRTIPCGFWLATVASTRAPATRPRGYWMLLIAEKTTVSPWCLPLILLNMLCLESSTSISVYLCLYLCWSYCLENWERWDKHR